jgi:type IV secretory pathway VirB10-like protein
MKIYTQNETQKNRTKNQKNRNENQKKQNENQKNQNENQKNQSQNQKKKKKKKKKNQDQTEVHIYTLHKIESFMYLLAYDTIISDQAVQPSVLLFYLCD